MELPIQEVWLHRQEKNVLDVIDGQQRLTTILAFANGKFPNGKPFSLKVMLMRGHIIQLFSLSNQ